MVSSRRDVAEYKGLVAKAGAAVQWLDRRQDGADSLGRSGGLKGPSVNCCRRCKSVLFQDRRASGVGAMAKRGKGMTYENTVQNKSRPRGARLCRNVPGGDRTTIEWFCLAVVGCVPPRSSRGTSQPRGYVGRRIDSSSAFHSMGGIQIGRAQGKNTKTGATGRGLKNNPGATDEAFCIGGKVS